MQDKRYLFSGTDLDIFGGSAFKDESLRTEPQSSFDCKNLDGVSGEVPPTKNNATDQEPRFDQRSFNMPENQAGQRLNNKSDETGSGERAQEWWYTDPTGALQGPFHYTKMREWYNQGFFKHHLPIRCHQNTPFIPLGKWFASNNPAFCDKVPDNWREITEYEKDKEEVKKDLEPVAAPRKSPAPKAEPTQGLYDSSANLTSSILPAAPLTTNTTKSKSDWWESPTTASFNNDNWTNSRPRREFQPASKIPTGPLQTGGSKLITSTTDAVLQAGATQVNSKGALAGRDYLNGSLPLNKLTDTLVDDATPASWPLNMDSLNQSSTLNDAQEARRTPLPGSKGIPLNDSRRMGGGGGGAGGTGGTRNAYGSGNNLTGTSPAPSTMLKGLGYEPVPITPQAAASSTNVLQGSPSTATHQQQPAQQQEDPRVEQTDHRIEQPAAMNSHVQARAPARPTAQHHVPVRKSEQPSTWNQRKPAQVQRRAERRPEAGSSRAGTGRRSRGGGQQALSWVQRTSSHRGGQAQGGRTNASQQQARSHVVNKKPASSWGGQAGHKQPRSAQKAQKPKETGKKSFSGRKEENKKKREEPKHPPPQTNLENPFGGQKMSPDFAKWCKEQLAQLSKPGENDFTDLVKFLMSLNSEKETREVITQYLGNTPKVLTFADGFLLRKDFDHENLTKGSNRGGGDGKKNGGARRRNRGRRT